MNAFSSLTLDRIAEIIPERLNTVNLITRFFNEMGYSLPDYPGGGYSKKSYTRDILSNIQKTRGGSEIVRVLLQLCDAKEYPTPIEHYTILQKINLILLPYHLAISTENVLMEDGKPIRIESEASKPSEAIRLFDLREYHPEVVKHARDLLAKDEYFHAVFECCKSFDKYVSARSKINETGVKLMGSALAIPKGPLRLNSQQTDTEKSLQEGVMQLAIGLVRAIRNPAGHETYLERPMILKDALDILSLISYLYRQIDGAFYLPTP